MILLFCVWLIPFTIKVSNSTHFAAHNGISCFYGLPRFHNICTLLFSFQSSMGGHIPLIKYLGYCGQCYREHENEGLFHMLISFPQYICPNTEWLGLKIYLLLKWYTVYLFGLYVHFYASASIFCQPYSIILKSGTIMPPSFLFKVASVTQHQCLSIGFFFLVYYIIHSFER